MPPVPVDPALVPILEAVNSNPLTRDPTQSVQQQRDVAHGYMQASFVDLGDPAPDVASVEDRQVPVDGGEITVRVYTPLGDGPFPVHVYFHGGAFWLGELDHFDIQCKELCAGAGCVVVSTDYRLAPENKFPTPVEDCYSALLWTVANAEELQIDTSRVSIGGGSAGGDLTAVVAMMARDRNGPPLVLQVLDIPVTDLTMSCPSVVENGEGYLLTRAAIEQYVDFYLEDPGDAKNPYASPLMAEDLSGLPPAVVMTAEFDPLRDEGEAYAARLAEAGVPVKQKRWLGHVHGSASMTALVPSAREWRDEIIQALREAYGRS
jgi:acetyl esterase